MTSKRVPAPLYKGATVEGIDVSRWQGSIASSFNDLALRNPEIKFCICRTGDGKDIDNTFQANFKAAKREGWFAGSYHYFRADRDGDSQAQLIHGELMRAGWQRGIDMPPAIDLEGGADLDVPGGVFTGPKGQSLPTELVHAELLECLVALERLCGVKPFLYTGQAFHWWFSQAQPSLAKDFAPYKLWVPSYTRSCLLPADKNGKPFPWDEWTIWQYTSTKVFDGVYSKPLDTNRFRGSTADFVKFCGLETAVTQPVQSCVTDAERAMLQGLLSDLQQRMDEIAKKLK